MILTGDYHTHTKFSHGKGTILENAIVAQEKGLKEIGITDHGFAHPAFGLRNYKIPKMQKLCQDATEKTSVKVLLGIESNITGVDGKVDLKEKNYDKFDLFLAGFHKFVMYKPNSIFGFAIPNIWNSFIKKEEVSNRLRAESTKAFINVIKKNPVDVITHLNYCCYTNAVEVAKAAADYGTYLEISAKKGHLTDEELYAIVKTGVNFIVNSDAHAPNRVGEISLAKQVIERVGISKDRIVNIDGKMPKFRFASFKGGV